MESYFVFLCHTICCEKITSGIYVLYTLYSLPLWYSARNLGYCVLFIGKNNVMYFVSFKIFNLFCSYSIWGIPY